MDATAGIDFKILGEHELSKTVSHVVRLLICRNGYAELALPAPDLKHFKQLLDLASAHGVGPALSKGVSNLAVRDPGWSALLPFFDAFEEANRVRNQKLLKSASKLARILAEISVKPIFLKGMAFVIEAGDGAPWREISDLDVLIDPLKLQAAANHLLEQGYRLGPDIDGYHADLHHHYPPIHDDEFSVAVELHCRLTKYPSDSPVQANEIIANARGIMRDGQSLLIPAAEHRYMHLVVHAQISNWGYALRTVYLRDLLDALELNTAHQLDWRSIANSLTSSHAGEEFCSFQLAGHQLLGLDLPPAMSSTAAAEVWAAEAHINLARMLQRWQSYLRLVRRQTQLLIRDPRRTHHLWKRILFRARLHFY